MEDWSHQMSKPRKIKNLLTYLLTYLLGGHHFLGSTNPDVILKRMHNLYTHGKMLGNTSSPNFMFLKFQLHVAWQYHFFTAYICKHCLLLYLNY